MTAPNQGGFKPRVYKFASLNKLVKFDNTNPECEGMNLSVTVKGPSMVQIQVYNRNTSKSVAFSFYLVDVIPWVNDIITILESKPNEPLINHEISGSLPAIARKPGKPSVGNFIISSDDSGPYIQLTVDTAVLPKWRFKPIPTTIFIKGDKEIKYSDNKRLLSWLKTFVGTVTLVSDYIAAIEAREWTPPEQEIEIKPTVENKPTGEDSLPKDDDIPFSHGESTKKVG